MDLNANLLAFLKTCRPGKFAAGMWLATLSDVSLDVLAEITSRAESGEQKALDELLQLAIILMSAEHASQKISFEPELVYGVGKLASFQKLARAGMIVLKKPLSLTGELEIEITKSGRKHYDKMISGATFH